MAETEIILHNWNIIVNCYYFNTKEYWKLKPPSLSLHKKWSFPVRFFSVNMTKPAFTGEILNGKKLDFLYSVFENRKILVIENSSSENKRVLVIALKL